MPNNWGDWLFSRLDQDELVTKTDSDKMVAELRERLDENDAKIKRLFDVYFEGDIDRENYQTKRADLMNEKKSFEAKIEQILIDADFWIKPARNWVKNAVSLCEIGEDSPHEAIAQARHFAKLTV